MPFFSPPSGRTSSCTRCGHTPRRSRWTDAGSGAASRSCPSSSCSCWPGGARSPGLDPQSRKAWSRLAIAFLLGWLGDLLWVIHLLVLPLDILPVLQNVSYVLWYVVMMLGVLCFPGFLRTRAEILQFVLDAAIVLLGGFMLFWSMIYVPAATLAGRQTMDLARAVWYPLGDLLLALACSMIAARHWREPIRPVFLLLLVGLLVSFVNDVSFGLQVLRRERLVAIADESFYLFGWFVYGATAFAQRRLALTHGPNLIGGGSRERGMNLLPYIAAGVGYATLFVAVLQGHAASLRGLVVGAVLLTAAVLLRQAFAIRENMGLVTERAARENEAALRRSEQTTQDRTASSMP